MFARKFLSAIIIAVGLTVISCQNPQNQNAATVVTSLRVVPSVRLNYRYEADVPPPDLQVIGSEDQKALVQADFDANRLNETLIRTISSPNGSRILTLYQRPNDLPADYRLDIYSADGKLIQKVTQENMAARFPETIVWSPDSSSVAFVAVARAVTAENLQTPEQEPTSDLKPADLDSNSVSNSDVNAGTEIDSNSNLNTAQATPSSTPSAATTDVLTFRTEQVYICNSDGGNLKALTQTEGLIYFYFVWSPDSSMLAALASTGQEWQYLQSRADGNAEVFVPVGRPRVIEKTGRERRLDDNLTAVQPVWSPDSAKIACGYDTQVRIYDSSGDSPTQAAVPLRNNLLLSSKAYDADHLRRAG